MIKHDVDELAVSVFDLDGYSSRHQKVIDEALTFGIGYRRKGVNKNAEAKANKEYRDLLRERTNKIIARDKELTERGILVGLDGPDYYKDIDKWFDSRVKDIRENMEQQSKHRYGGALLMEKTMINVKVRQNSIEVSGHAGAAPRGQSVPCAGVSLLRGAENGATIWKNVSESTTKKRESPRAYKQERLSLSHIFVKSMLH